MDTLLSYSLTDMLMFTPQAYARLFETYNRSIWPAQLPVIALTIWLVQRARHAEAVRARLVSVLIAASWSAIAWFFFLKHYATINIAAPWFAAGFLVEALLLVVVGAGLGRLQYVGRGRAAIAGAAMLILAVTIMPVISLLDGRSWRGIELFGLAPDPTAVGTIGLLLSAQGKMRWLLLPIPLAWCLVSLLTHVAMVIKA